MQLVGARFVTRGSTNQKVGAPPPPGFPHTMLNVENVKDNISLKRSLPTVKSGLMCRQDTCASRVCHTKAKATYLTSVVFNCKKF